MPSFDTPHKVSIWVTDTGMIDRSVIPYSCQVEVMTCRCDRRVRVGAEIGCILRAIFDEGRGVGHDRMS